MLDDEDLALWVAGLNDLFALVADRFPRVESRLQARAHVRGLLASLASKNSWTLAEAAGNKTPDKMQRLLNRASWDDGGVRDDVRSYVARHLGDAGGVLIVDETGFVKKGARSAGVQQQYSGTAGRVENCQLGVFPAYASPKGRALVDRELYLPKSWTDDTERCREAGVPDSVQFASTQFRASLVAAFQAAHIIWPSIIGTSRRSSPPAAARSCLRLNGWRVHPRPTLGLDDAPG